MSEIDGILQLRESHSLRAAEHKIRKQAAFDRADRRVEDDKKTLTDFSNSLPDREQKLFDGVRGQTVKLKHIDNMRHKVRRLHDHEKSLQLKLEEGKKALAEAEKALAEAMEKFRLALRGVEKIKEAVKILAVKQKLADERAADKEIEETYATKQQADGEL